MTKLKRALVRMVIAGASLFGIVTIIGMQRDLRESSDEEFFQRASHYRIVEAPPPAAGEKTAEHNTTVEHEKYYDNEIVDEISLRLQERKTAIHKVCANDVSSAAKSVPVNNWEFIINHRYKLMWCSIFKSASSSWFDYFMTIAGVDPNVKKNSDVELARKTAYPRPSLDDALYFLNDPAYTSFVILREPFERILSSYQDKLIDSKLKFYHAVRCLMAKQKKSSRKCNPSFPQFVDFIVREHAAGKPLDEHWTPYTLFCSLCQVNYTYFLNFETLDEEQEYLINHVPGLEKYPPLHVHSSQRDYNELLRQHYGQLTREQLDGLVNVYRDDFLISGHSWLKYYDFINEEPPLTRGT